MQSATAADKRVAEDGFDLNSMVEQALQYIHGGRLDEAEALYTRIIEQKPDLSAAWFLYGLTAFKAGNNKAAAERLRRAVKMRRADPKYRLMLARACLAIGRNDEAIEALEGAARLTPDAPGVYLALVRAYTAAGRTEQAAISSRRVMHMLPRYWARQIIRQVARVAIPFLVVLAWPRRLSVPLRASWQYERGRLAERFRDTEKAIVFYRKAATAAPEWKLPLLQLGRKEFETEQFQASRTDLEAAYALAADDPDILAAYGQTLSRMAYHDEARDILVRAHRIAPDTAAILCQLGWACYRASDTHTAIEHFSTLLAMKPQDVDAHIGMANCHSDLGDSKTARDWYERTLELDPDHAGALRELANLKVLTCDDERFARLERLAQAPDAALSRRRVLNMALGEVYRAQGDPERAFAHYDLGNALKDVTFDIDTYRRYIDRIIQHFDSDHFARFSGAGDSSETPVFIVGMPRSGTSLVEQILASHPAVYGAGELEDMVRLADSLADSLDDDVGSEAAFPECVARLTPAVAAKLAGEQLARLQALAPEASRITDKMPGNFLLLGLIATLFPGAKIIHCQRDPLDVCLSIYFGEFAGYHGYAYNLENLGHYYREYERIMAHWNKVLPLGILDVRYEDVVDDVESMARRLLDHCGLPWDARCLEFHKTERSVHTRSKAQVRQPIYKSSRGRWRPYAPWLSPLADALGGGEPARLREACGETITVAEAAE